MTKKSLRLKLLKAMYAQAELEVDCEQRHDFIELVNAIENLERLHADLALVSTREHKEPIAEGADEEEFETDGDIVVIGEDLDD